jgi:aspartate aminotransferase-like enzyme
MFPDSELSAVAAAAHEVGALFVLDCVASGTAWAGACARPLFDST